MLHGMPLKLALQVKHGSSSIEWMINSLDLIDHASGLEVYSSVSKSFLDLEANVFVIWSFYFILSDIKRKM